METFLDSDIVPPTPDCECIFPVESVRFLLISQPVELISYSIKDAHGEEVLAAVNAPLHDVPDLDGISYTNFDLSDASFYGTGSLNVEKTFEDGTTEEYTVNMVITNPD